jgi:HAD superfamily hydrolase (TIGR01509 family)
MTKKAVLFDCDGVLVNTEQLGYCALKMILGEHDFGYTREEYVELVSGYEQCEAVQVIQDDFFSKKGYYLPEDFGETAWATVEDPNQKYLRAVKGMKSVLSRLHEEGIPIAVCSNNKRENVERNLRRVGLLDYFDGHIYTKEDVENPKPAPDIYEMGADKLGIDPSDCFIVEDSQTGTKAGVAAGGTVIGFIGEAHRHIFKESFLLAEAGADIIATDGAKLKKHILMGVGIDEPPCPLFSCLLDTITNKPQTP